MATKNDEASSDCSREEMVPMGKIAVRHELEWEARGREDSAAPDVKQATSSIYPHAVS